RPIGEPLQHQGQVMDVAFSPDGRSVLTASTDNTARLWDVATGRPLGPPWLHPILVKSVTFSPDGEYALTLTGGDEGRNIAGLGKLPAAGGGGAERAAVWLKPTRGVGVVPKGAARALDAAAGRARRGALNQLGGPPISSHSAERAGGPISR